MQFCWTEFCNVERYFDVEIDDQFLVALRAHLKDEFDWSDESRPLTIKEVIALTGFECNLTGEDSISPEELRLLRARQFEELKRKPERRFHWPSNDESLSTAIRNFFIDCAYDNYVGEGEWNVEDSNGSFEDTDY